MEVSVSLIVFIVLIYYGVHGFNLDTKIPIVKRGRTSSYFGYSVAQHMIAEGGGNRANHVFIVGAPKDNITTLSAPEAVRSLNAPGVIYSCPISTYDDDCRALDIDNEVPRSDEDKNDQWMGVSVSSQRTLDGKVVVCGHRYKQASASAIWGLGLCITLSNQLDTDEYLEPCGGDLPKQGGHNEWGVCQAGTSVATSATGEVAVGIPGSYNWRGTVAANIIRDSLDEFPQWYYSPVAKGPPRPITAYYSNLGMSVKIGNLTVHRRLTYIGGSPKADGVGKVFLLHKGNSWLMVEPDHILTGEKVGSMFGHDTAVVDLNNDGRQDLVVAAPFYHEDDMDIGGAIYVYMNGPGGITSETVPVVIKSREMTAEECGQLDCKNARFGFAISSIGDLNKDGFNDLAVGAPYEGDGAVYIFRGSKEGIRTKYSQRIAAVDLITARTLRTFGYSLSGGLDMDQNGYPDLVVGSYASDKTLVLRARPVITIKSQFTTDPPNFQIDYDRDRCPYDGSNYNCFQLRVCLLIQSDASNRFTTGLDVDYSIEAEKFTGKKLSRVFFRGFGVDKNNAHIYSNSMKLQEQNECNSKNVDRVTVYVNKNNRDYLNAIQFQLTVKLKEIAPPTVQPGQSLPDINTYPILNEEDALIILPVDFKKDCGRDLKCHSDLVVRGVLQLERDENNEPLFKIGEIDELLLDILIQNKAEDAHETTLTITLPESLSYTGLLRKSKYSCIPNPENKKVVSCSIGNPMKQNSEASFTIKLSPDQVKSTQKKIDISLSVNTTSIETDDTDNFDMVRARVIVATDIEVRGISSPPGVFYGGDIKGESAMKYFEDIGPEVTHKYEIKNVGDGHLSRSTIYIEWPYEVRSSYPHGKHVLYVQEPPVIAAPGKCYMPDKYVNPINLQARPEGIEDKPSSNATAAKGTNAYFRTVKRSGTVNTEIVHDSTTGKKLRVVTLDCDKRTAKCVRFNCSIGFMRSRASVSIEIKSRLWASTFLMDYRKVDEVRIASKAELYIDPILNVQQPITSNDRASAKTVASPDVAVVEPKGVPIWIIILSIILGLVLLILLIICLWKFGFFKRRRRQDMTQTATLQKSKNKSKNKEKKNDKTKYNSMTKQYRDEYYS